MTKKRKKLRSNEDEERPSKTQRVEVSNSRHREKDVVLEDEEVVVENKDSMSSLDRNSPWRNLQLILSLQNKNIDLPQKVELAYDYVKSRRAGEEDDANQTVRIFRLVVFLNDWVQSLLIPSEKKMRVEDDKLSNEVSGSCLDFRCWEIFKFCLEESLKYKLSLSFSRNLLRAIHFVAREALSMLPNGPMKLKDFGFVSDGFELYGVVPDCVSLVFSLHGGVLNPNLDTWVLVVNVVIELVCRSYSDNLGGAGNLHQFAMRLSCHVLEPFAKFLRVHPSKKNGFRDFVDKLLEPLLQLLGLLHNHVDCSSYESARNILKLIEEVLAYGLFHQSHIGGFLNLNSTEKYRTSNDEKFQDSKTIIKSYHRHLFDKLESMIAGKRVLALCAVGDVFSLFVNRVKREKKVSENMEGAKISGKAGSGSRLEDDFLGKKSKMYGENSGSISEHGDSLNVLTAEARKSVIDFVVLIMEPFLLDIDSYLQSGKDVKSDCFNSLCSFKSINKILASFMHHNVFVQTEDLSGGACLNFLRKAYDTLVSFSSRMNQAWILRSDTQMEMLNSIAKELIVAISHFLEIDYEIVGSDLVSLWLIVLSYLDFDTSSSDQCSLIQGISTLGCQVVNLYSELRQVNNAIYALCKAVRLSIMHDDGDYQKFTSRNAFLSPEVYAKLLGKLLSSQEFRLSIFNAVKSIPEGQASGCIRDLTTDLLESLEWVKACSSMDGRQTELGNMLELNLSMELLGRFLSELYALVMDSLNITAGNSVLVGTSVKEMMKILCPRMGLISQPSNIKEFLLSVLGRTFDRLAECKSDALDLRVSTFWVFLFFFRVYMSSRSLFRQVMSLVPPDLSRKLSATMGDSITVYSGNEWLEQNSWKQGGYFNWIVQSSASLLEIIHSVLDIYLQDNSADCSPLIFVMQNMALQRLVDLNRQISSLEYLLQHNNHIVESELMDDDGLPEECKKSKKVKGRISKLKQEAAGLTHFLMGYLSVVAKEHLVSPLDEKTCVHALQEDNAWDLCVCSLDRGSLPTAVWWSMCQNADIWCNHASKKNLKKFLSHLIHTSIAYDKEDLDGKQKLSRIQSGPSGKVTMHQISLEVLGDSLFFEQSVRQSSDLKPFSLVFTFSFVRRLLTSRLCRMLERLVLPLLIYCLPGGFDFKTFPTSMELLRALDNSMWSDLVSRNNLSNGSSKCFEDQDAFPTIKIDFKACQNLLKLLCWIPKSYLDYKQFLLCTTYLLNIERLIICCLLNCHGGPLLQNYTELLRILVYCRKAFRYLLVAPFAGKEVIQTSFTRILFDTPFPISWLLKSVALVIGNQHIFPEDSASQVKDLIFSLIDQTSNVFMMLNKNQFAISVNLLTDAKKPCRRSNSTISDKESDLFDTSERVDAWKGIVLVAETLTQEAESLLVSLKAAPDNTEGGVSVSVTDVNKLSSLLSCFQGFLWSLTSTKEHEEPNDNVVKVLSLNGDKEIFHELNQCMNSFADLINLCIQVLFFSDELLRARLVDGQSLPLSDYHINQLGLEESSTDHSVGETDVRNRIQQQSLGACSIFLASSEINDDSAANNLPKKRRKSKKGSRVASLLAEVKMSECLKKPFLRSLLEGENPEVAFLVRQLIFAASAILRLDFLTKWASLSERLVPVVASISHFLLFEFTDMAEMPQAFTFVWLDSIVKYLEELGRYLSSSNPAISNKMYTKLIELQIRAIGKCTSLQGKSAKLASHDIESYTKTLHCQMKSSELSFSHGPYLDELKTRLRMSFKVFTMKPSEVHLSSALQTLERALFGMKEGSAIVTGDTNGGKVSPVVAAGIDCLDLFLEYVSGRKRLSMVKGHIEGFVAGLLNVTLHLQGPLIFCSRLDHGGDDACPDPGAVVLMCVEVLTRISGKNTLFPMESFHVAQSLRTPGALFQHFCEPRHNNDFLVTSSDWECESVQSTTYIVDVQFSVDLYAACCRLLYTVLKHQRRESQLCIALLEDSVRALLHSLERVNTNQMVRNNQFEWDVENGVRCASFLRRIYEELRQQKDVYGGHCFRFLSDYVWIFSGYGPLRRGIRREIDETLRPGVYALIDACSSEDLQLLHTEFGVISIFLGIKWFFSYEEVLESTEQRVNWVLLATPIVILLAVKWLSSVEYPGRFFGMSPYDRRCRTYPRSSEGSSPWLVAAFIVLLLIMVQYQSVFLDSWLI
ncbi:Nucleolar 27S pre-rRNA processing, Urb2/Npa2, C-terminal [Dillenia turbinata]|uniref:Nucleolar 27S pre-rRNA processing, Urb2/Npa2, C-terminal n=1 Tax=Dillenia turbinata TaxID=194707 RepID=A0AAN8ZQZ0_9MAGN